MKLSALSRCFEGHVAASVATVSADGIPNVSYLSQVQLVDDKHVALSYQFFNKTRANVDATGRASCGMYDPDTGAMYRLQLRFDHSETSGPLFDMLSARIEAIASHSGMTGVFKLLAADVYEVLDVEVLPTKPDAKSIAHFEPVPVGELLGGMRLLSHGINRAESLDQLFSSMLELLEGTFGLAHSMVLLVDESGERLYTIASHGYPANGVGAEVKIGDGLIGMVAQKRQLVRLSDVKRELRYARASGAPCTEEIPLPGMQHAALQIALPLTVGDELLGVLSAESAEPIALGANEETFLSLLANQASLALHRLLRDNDDAPASSTTPPAIATAVRRQFTYYPADDCMFVDGDYLIRNVPGRILWKLLSEGKQGKREFSNRELRLDSSLGLPSFKDNLETRLLLLRKRLEQKCPDIRIERTARGRFALRVDGDYSLDIKS